MFSTTYFEIILPYARLQRDLEDMEDLWYDRHKATALLRSRMLGAMEDQLERWQGEWERIVEEAEEVFDACLSSDKVRIKVNLWLHLTRMSADIHKRLSPRENTTFQDLTQHTAEVYLALHSAMKECCRDCREAERKVQKQIVATQSRFALQPILDNVNQTRLRHPRSRN